MTACFKGQAQFNAIERDIKFSHRLFHFGIEIGLNTGNYRVSVDSNFMKTHSIYSVTSQTGSGFTLGIVSDLHLGKYFDLRFIPDLSFGQRTLAYRDYGDSTTLKQIQSTYIDFPVHVKFKSKPYHDMKVYCLMGMKYSYDLSSNAKTRKSENLVKVNAQNWELDYGFGIEFHLPLVIIAPEIKFSYGLDNILYPNPTLIYSNVLTGLRTRTVLFTIHFEG